MSRRKSNLPKKGQKIRLVSLNNNVINAEVVSVKYVSFVDKENKTHRRTLSYCYNANKSCVDRCINFEGEKYYEEG